MKIVAVKTRLEHLPLTRPYTIAYQTCDEAINFILEIRTDDGRLGMGAAAPAPEVTGETTTACGDALGDDALGWLIGADIDRIGSLHRQLERHMPADTPGARAAVDIALHDLFAQRLAAPLVDVLGRVHHALPTSVTIGIQSVEETLDEAIEHIGHGFRVLKVKLGHSFEEDIARLTRLRESLDKTIVIRIDPNQGYSIEDLKKFVSRTKHLDIEFIEQPVTVDAMDRLRELDSQIRDQIAADESLLTAREAVALIAPPRACGIFNIKLMKCGGIKPALDIATVAETARVSLMWGCMDESIISITAALHAALACPATRYLDLDGSLDLARDVVAGGFILQEGCLSVSDAPGLGVMPL